VLFKKLKAKFSTELYLFGPCFTDFAEQNPVPRVFELLVEHQHIITKN